MLKITPKAAVLTFFATALGFLSMAIKADVNKAALRDLAEARGLKIGAAAAYEPLRDEPIYSWTLAREFDLVTPENVMKFSYLQPEKGRFDFGPADFLARFAKKNKMLVRGHCLVWHESLPDWLKQGQLTKAELKEILCRHIKTVVGHYQGKVAYWDVVNEAFNDDGTLRPTIWLEAIGPEYLELAFRWAHEADPQAKLFYNDYNAEGLGRKSDAVYQKLKELLKKGVPIHGLGLQMHLALDKWSPLESVRQNMERLAALGLEIHITEMDIETYRAANLSNEKKTALQARLYADMLETALTVPNFKAFILWGFTDKHTWITWSAGQPDTPLIFDQDYQKKPAYWAIQAVLDQKRIQSQTNQ